MKNKILLKIKFFLNAPFILGISILVSDYLSFKDKRFFLGNFCEIYPDKYGAVFFFLIKLILGCIFFGFGISQAVGKIRQTKKK